MNNFTALGSLSASLKSSQQDASVREINTSNVDFINKIWLVRPLSTIIVESTIFFPVVLFGIFGNILSVYILVKNAHIRTPTNLLIGNMAMADLLSLLIHPWIFITYDSFQNYQIGSFGCKVEGAFECSLLIASVISVSAISYDRLTAIVLPRETRLTKNGTKIVMVVTWIVGFLISIPLFMYRTYKERQWKNFLEKYCTENTLIINTYWYVIITVLVWVPLMFQLICYICIFIKLNKYEKVVLRRLEYHQVNYKKNAVRMMFAMIVTFIICRVPFTALIIYRHQLLQSKALSTLNETQPTVSGTYHTLWFISKFLIFLNAALNPLIYSVTNEKFRRGFKTTTLSKWLFPSRHNNTTTTKTKALDTTMFRNNLFFIFKRRQKVVTYADGVEIISAGKTANEINLNCTQ